MTTPRGMLAYGDLSKSAQEHLLALEEFIGDCDGKDTVISNGDTCIDDGTIDASDAVKAFNGIVAALRQAAAPQGREATIEECAKIADGWLKIFSNREIQYTSAREYACDAVADIAENIRALTPAVAPDGAGDALLTEQERHAVGHARYQVDHATPDNTECCFDYELVATLIGVVDRLAALAQAQEPGEDKR